MTSSPLTGIGPGLQQLVEQRDDEVKEVRAAENVDQELLVQLKQLPHQDVELLGEEDLLDRVREVGLGEVRGEEEEEEEEEEACKITDYSRTSDYGHSNKRVQNSL